jgi:hypothetical protein
MFALKLKHVYNQRNKVLVSTLQLWLIGSRKGIIRGEQKEYICTCK